MTGASVIDLPPMSTPFVNLLRRLAWPVGIFLGLVLVAYALLVISSLIFRRLAIL